MDGWLRRNTAATLKAGPFVSATDGFTLSTGGIPLASTDVRLSKNGGDFAGKASATTSVYDENGYYDVALSTGDIGTAGRLKVHFYQTTGFLPCAWQDFVVLPEPVYDARVSATGYLAVNA